VIKGRDKPKKIMTMIIPSRKVPGILLLPISRGRMKQGVPR
jgi:hypothetical protein